MIPIPGIAESDKKRMEKLYPDINALIPKPDQIKLQSRILILNKDHKKHLARTVKNGDWFQYNIQMQRIKVAGELGILELQIREYWGAESEEYEQVKRAFEKINSLVDLWSEI